MRKYSILLNLLLISLLALPSMVSAQDFELVWSEEFEGDALDTSIWNYEIGSGANNELQYSTNRPENIFVSDGKLTIRGLQETYGGKSYTSARINTNDKFNFTYGKVEAYMKLPYGQGIWPAFWMLGEAYSDVGWPGCGEIDIMEMVGGTNGDNTIHSTLHWGEWIDGGHPSYGQNYQLDEGIFTDTFHLVTTVWEDDVIRTYCDSILFYTITMTEDQFNAFDEKFYLILNMAIGGDWPGSPDGTTVFPQDFLIDYVRVYKSAETLSIDGPEEVYPSDSAVAYSILGGEDWSYAWTLPEGASILGDADTNNILVNWGCVAGEISCHVTGGAIDATITLDVSLAEPKISGPLFFTDNQTGLEFSFPALSNTSYAWEVPADATLVSGDGTSSIVVDWGTTMDSIKLLIENDCGIQSFAQIVLAEGQYPYPDPFTPHAIPGTISSTDFDYGGEGVAYHDVGSTNQGPGPRPDEGVDTENNDGGSNIGWNEGGEWTEYTVAVEETGYYSIAVRVATQNTSGISPLNILFNSENRAGNITIPTTGSWSNFVTVTKAPVYLEDTDTLMRLDFGGGGFNTGRITITPYTGDKVENQGLSESVRLFPNPVSNTLHLTSEASIEEISIIDFTGKIQLQLTNPSGSELEIDTSSLPSGFYFVRLINSDSEIQNLKFIKK